MSWERQLRYGEVRRNDSYVPLSGAVVGTSGLCTEATRPPAAPDL